MTEETLRARIFRYDPSADKEPRYEIYDVPKKERMLVGDLLEYIHENLDGNLAYRWECRIRQCGSCTILINGKPGLICRESAKDGMVLEPLPFLPIVRDLVVDRNPLLEKIYSVRGFNRSSPSKEHPEPIEPSKVDELRAYRQCVQCLACVAVCPDAEELTADLFPGPTKLIQIARFAFDERDKADRAEESEKARVYCSNCHACEEVCPHEIDIFDKVITALRNRCYQQGIGVGTKYLKAFKDLILEKGKVNAAALLVKTHGYSGAALKILKGARLASKGKLVSPFEKPIPKVEEVRTIMRVEKEGK
jgi:succinate dehydrogenase/fumarate reductase iron-sulfur protein